MNIKKIIAGLSAFATAFTLCTAIDGNTLSAADVTYYIVGDANEDDKLNVRDAAYIASALSKGKASELYISADYNQDNSINVRDAAGIARYCAESYSSDIPVTTVPLTTTTTVGTMIITATTTTTTVTDVPVENTTEPVTTTEVTIPDLPVETTGPVTTTEVTETTVATTSEPVETTTVTTTTQVVETTVAKKSIEDFYIIYNVSPIYEMHSLEYQTYVSKSLYFYELDEGLREWFQEEFKENENYNADFASYFRATVMEDQGSFTNMRLIGFNYTFYKAYTDDSKTEEITKGEIEKAIGYEVPDKFKSSMCLDGNTDTAVDVGITVDDYGFSCYPYGSTYVNMITLQKISPVSGVDLSSYVVDFANEENAVIFLNSITNKYTIDSYPDYSNAIRG